MSLHKSKLRKGNGVEFATFCLCYALCAPTLLFASSAAEALRGCDLEVPAELL
jgi:hypothetical protein